MQNGSVAPARAATIARLQAEAENTGIVSEMADALFFQCVWTANEVSAATDRMVRELKAAGRHPSGYRPILRELRTDLEAVARIRNDEVTGRLLLVTAHYRAQVALGEQLHLIRGGHGPAPLMTPRAFIWAVLGRSRNTERAFQRGLSPIRLAAESAGERGPSIQPWPPLEHARPVQQLPEPWRSEVPKKIVAAPAAEPVSPPVPVEPPTADDPGPMPVAAAEPAPVPPIAAAPIVETPQPSAAPAYSPSPAFLAAEAEHERWKAEAAIWDREIRVATTFNSRAPLLATTPRQMFGSRDPGATPTEALNRAMSMARWLRNQQNAPWVWIDSQMKQIAYAEARLARETPRTPGWSARFDEWAAIARAFEVEMEERVRRYLSADAFQRGRDSIASNAVAAAPPAPAESAHPAPVPSAPSPPPSEAAAFAMMTALLNPRAHLAAVDIIARLRARGVYFRLDDVSGMVIGPASMLTGDDFRAIDAAGRDVIERILR